MRNPYVIALCVLSFAGVAYATGQIGVTGYPAVPRVLKGGTGINIAPDGTFSATGEAVVTGSQPFGNLSSALRGKYLGATGTAVNAGAYKGNSTPTATEFGYMAGVKAPVQGQISSANVRIDTLNSTAITTSNIGAQTVAAATGNAGTATKLETARNINGVAFDGTAPITVRDAGYLNYSGHDHVTPALVNASAATPADSDSFSFFNSVLKKVSWSGIKSSLKTYFDNLYHGLTVTWSEITGKPTFATVATSGNYSDLNGKPAAYSLPTASTIVKGGVMIDGSSIQIDGSGVIHSTVAAGVSSVQEYTGDITLQLSDFPDIVAGLDSKVSQVAFNNQSAAQGTRNAAQDSAIALKAPIASPTFTGTVTAPAYNSSASDGGYLLNVRNTIAPTFAPAEGDMYTDSAGKIWLYISGQWVDKTYVLPAATSDTLGGVKVGSKLSITNGVLDVMVSSLGPTGLVTAGLAGEPTISSGFAYVATSTPWKATFNSYTSTKQTTVFAVYSGILCSASGSKLYWPNPITFTNNSSVCAKLRTGTRATVQMQGGKTYATATQNLQKVVTEVVASPSFAATDSFGYVANPIGASQNWATVTSAGGMRSDGSVAFSVTGEGTARRTETFADNQYAQVKLAASTPGADSGVVVRASASARTFYYLFQHLTTQVILAKKVAGSYTAIHTYTQATTAGDVLKLAVSGSTLTPYVNGTPLQSYTDTAITSGSPGIFSAGTAATVDDFEGGNL